MRRLRRCGTIALTWADTLSQLDITSIIGERRSGGQGASEARTAPVTKTPHDALFKSVFQQPENVAAELQHVLPAEHVAAIDWTTLKLEPGSCVDEWQTSTATCCSSPRRKSRASGELEETFGASFGNNEWVPEVGDFGVVVVDELPGFAGEPSC